MKKLINAPETVVADALRGIEAAHGDRLRISQDPAYIVRADAPVAGKVGLVSGGGAGHEPMHGGFVGPGMLDAACPGEVFTSPTPDQMAAAIAAVDGGAGVVQIIKNYTGDVMNFEMASELVGAQGVEVENVLINDDVAVEDSTFTAGRRGVGATVLVEKISGAAAAAGRPLAEVAELGRRVNAQARSMGLALTPCITPASGLPSFELGDDEVEIGIGIHGEPGRSKEAMAPAAELTARLMEPILGDLPFAAGDRVLAFVNGLGGTPLLELYIVYAEVARLAAEHGLTIERNLVGNYITSLEMQGCSITLLRVDDELLQWWDAPVDTPALRWGGVVAVDRDTTIAWMRLFAEAVAEHREELVALDTAIGDGDHGTNLNRGMATAMEKLQDAPPADVGAVLTAVATTLVSTVGGAAGPLYGTLLLRMGTALAGREDVELAAFAAAFAAGAEGVQARGKAQAGDKTMLDALLPAVAALAAGDDLDGALADAEQAARAGMEATTPIVARRGRASYLGERSAGHQDPGATSTYYLMRAARAALTG